MAQTPKKPGKEAESQGKIGIASRIRSSDPDQRKVSERQAVHLAKMARVDVEELKDRKIADLNEALKWKIAPELLLFRCIEGKVVKRNPTTGELEPVPNATVHVEDTDCSFLGFFPTESPWSWFFPFHCRREEIATVITDTCGRFRVCIPRWEIDRILRFRRARICWPEIFRPTIREIVEWIKPLPKPPELRIPPRPEPDPLPELLVRPGIRQRLGEVLDTQVVEQLEGLTIARAFGESSRPLDEFMDSPALSPNMPPPLPAGLGSAELRKSATALAPELDLEERVAAEVDFGRWIGPFWRCRDIYIPYWKTFLDVPDITFRVSQDVDGDGDEETIYSEGFFDVRWNAGAIPDVILEADPIAHSIPICEGPDIDPGLCKKPEIRTAGLMTLEPTHHDAASGYATRPDRPKPGGFVSSPSMGPAEAPYWRTVQLHGCHRFQNAPFYRLSYQYGSGSEVPFTGLSWSTPRLTPGNPPMLVSPDSQGWYEVLNVPDLVFPWWLLNWPTRNYPDGKYKVRLQLGNAAKNVIEQSGQVAFIVDNRRPDVAINEIRWRAAGDAGPGILLPEVCPIIERLTGTDIELILDYTASAAHFRDVDVKGHNCRAGWLSRTYPGAGDRGRYEHWHTGVSDNSWSGTAVFSLPAAVGGQSTQGVSSLWVYARGRAFNPAGSDGGPGADWLYDPVFSWRHPHRDISVVDV